MVIEEIIARAGVDDVRAAVAVDRLGAIAAGDRVRAGRAQDREGGDGGRRIDVGEAGNGGRGRNILVERRR